MLIGLALESVAEVGMGDSNKCFGTLRFRFSLEIDHALFGGDIRHVGARGCDDITKRQCEDDPASPVGTLIVGRGQAQDGLAAFRCIRTAHELQLPTGLVVHIHSRVRRVDPSPGAPGPTRRALNTDDRFSPKARTACRFGFATSASTHDTVSATTFRSTSARYRTIIAASSIPSTSSFSRHARCRKTAISI